MQVGVHQNFLLKLVLSLRRYNGNVATMFLKNDINFNDVISNSNFVNSFFW